MAKETGLKYIPLYTSSPIGQRPSHISANEGNDSHLQCDLGGGNDSDDSSAEEIPLANTLKYHSAQFSNMLALPQAPCEIPTKYPKSSGRALTLEQQLAADDAKVKAKAAAKEKKSKGKKSKQKQAKQDQSTLEPAQVREEPQDGARSGK